MTDHDNSLILFGFQEKNGNMGHKQKSSFGALLSLGYGFESQESWEFWAFPLDRSKPSLRSFWGASLCIYKWRHFDGHSQGIY